MTKKQDPNKINPLSHNVFSPQEVGTRSALVVQERVDDPYGGMTFGCPVLDRFLSPARPGEVVGYLGYTSNFKSSAMAMTSEYHAKRFREINRKNMQNNSNPIEDAVVTVLWEQSIEEAGVIDIARVQRLDVDKMMRGKLNESEIKSMWDGARERGSLPWWLIGHSVLDEAGRPRLSMSDVKIALDILKGQGVKIRLLVLDYLQRMRRETKDMREGFMNAVDDTRDVAIQYQVPTFLACQAGRKTKQRPAKWRLPQLDDAQETSNYEQSCYKSLHWWMPKNDNPIGSTIPYGGMRYTVTWDLIFCGILKNTFGKAPIIMPLRIDFENNALYALDNFDYAGLAPEIELTWEEVVKEAVKGKKSKALTPEDIPF